MHWIFYQQIMRNVFRRGHLRGLCLSWSSFPHRSPPSAVLSVAAMIPRCVLAGAEQCSQHQGHVSKFIEALSRLWHPQRSVIVDAA